MSKQVLKINQGDSGIFDETISGLESLSGYIAKLYCEDRNGNIFDTITGTISGLVISYEFFNDDTKVYPLGVNKFETKLFASGDIVATQSEGLLIVKPVIQKDPS